MDRVCLSVIVPCYKVEKYLSRCLDSLLSQTLREIEIICINDGSPDNCLSIMKSYRERHGGRIVIIDKENEGVWKARRDGIRLAKGEYTGFLDPDDFVESDYAKKLYNAAKRENDDIVSCGFARRDEATGRIYSMEMTHPKYRSFDIKRQSGLLLEVNPAPWNKIFRTELLKNMRDLKNIPPALDDMMFAQLIYMDARRITFIPDVLVNYFVRSSSIINSVSSGLAPKIYVSMRELKGTVCREKPYLIDYMDALAFLHLGISLMYRLYSAETTDFDRLLDMNTRYLNRYFPRWKTNRYLSISYVTGHRGANLRTLTVKTIYRLKLMKAFLCIYTALIKYIKIDIKW